MRNQFTPIEDVLNIFDNTRYWLYIPGFNGYEVSNDGYVRSMKHYVKYPCGILIKPVNIKSKDSCDPLYELSDDNNKRQRIHLSDIMQLAIKSQYSIGGYPRATMSTYSGSRNKWVKSDSGAYVKVYNGPGVRKLLNTPPMDNTVKYHHFPVIQSGTEYQVPIESIKGDEYYGRKDCRTHCGIDVHPGPECILDSSQQTPSYTFRPRRIEDGPETNNVWSIC